MKKPELKNLSKIKPSSNSDDNNAFREAVADQSRVANKVVRRTYSIESFYADYIDTIAATMTQEKGKIVNASQALRAILKRDMER